MRCLKKVLRYIGGSKRTVLKFKKFDDDFQDHIVVFSDASFADIIDDNMKSTAGYAGYYNGQIIDWRTCRIKWVCTSTTAAEFMALYYAVTNCIHFGYMMQEILK